jgi:HD-like signal output (HDOD) protein
MKTDYKKEIEGVRDFLPAMPAIMAELVEILNQSEVDLRVLGQVISKDPAMAVNVLRIANSAFYGLPNKVKTIDHAVTMIGLKEITSLCMACGVSGALRAFTGQKTIDLQAFWRHSVATGVIARTFCAQFSVNQDGNFYLAGLMHDVGKVILDRFLHNVYTEVIRLTYEENVSVAEAERQVLGDSHAKIGGWLMEKWGLPGIFADVACYHHSVMDAPKENREVVAVVSLANNVARLMGFGFGGDLRGTILAESEAFKVIRETNNQIEDMDIARFVMDLERNDSDIVEIERIMNAR